MRFLVAVCAALPLTAAAAGPTQNPAAGEHFIRFLQAAPDAQYPKPLMQPVAPQSRGELKKLTELPPADAFHAVYRLDSRGCIDPVMVGYQFGRTR
jgi:hypothetical protein